MCILISTPTGILSLSLQCLVDQLLLAAKTVTDGFTWSFLKVQCVTYRHWLVYQGVWKSICILKTWKWPQGWCQSSGVTSTELSKFLNEPHRWPEFPSPQARTHVLPPCGWPLSCLQLYRNEHRMNLHLPFCVTQTHRYFKTPSSRPTGGSQPTSLARNARDLCYGRQTGEAAVQIGQLLDILGMCKWSQLLAEGVERCQGSAAGGGCVCVWHHEKPKCTHKHTYNSTCRARAGSFGVKKRITWGVNFWIFFVGKI